MDLANPTVSDGKFEAMLWVHKANHDQFNSVWASETPVGVAMPRASQEEIAKVQPGASAQAVLFDPAAAGRVAGSRRRGGVEHERHRVRLAAPGIPGGLVGRDQEGLTAPIVSLPIQGTVATTASSPRVD